jgi:hypothetical protein
MMRVLWCSLAVLAMCAASAVGGDKDKAKDTGTKDRTDKKATSGKKGKEHRAQVVKVDPKKGTVTLRFRGREGKEMTRTFKLAEDIEYLDSTGRAASVDVFRSGDYVLVVEREGRIKQLKKHEKGSKTGAEKKSTDKKSDK